MSHIPNVRNHELYRAYLNFLNKVINDYCQFLNHIYRLKESRKDFDYAPFMKQLKQAMLSSTGRLDPMFEEFSFKDDVLLNQLVDFTIEGLCRELEDMQEYKECVRLINQDPAFKNHIDSYVRIFTYLPFFSHWIYISHFLKSMIFRFLQDHTIDMNLFNKLFSDLESFLSADLMEIIVICPLHFFPSKIDCTQLSDKLSIRRLKNDEKISLWNRFMLPDLISSPNTISHVIEYKFMLVKGEDDNYQSDFRHRTTHIFSAVVTLFRLLGINLAIYDEYTIPTLDIPLGYIPMNLFVAALGVTYWGNVSVDSIMMLKYVDLWTEFGVLLADKVLNNKRFEGDPFGNLKVSINRFNNAFERKDGHDAFIDNIVALEALFSKEDDDFRRTTERLSKRLALFLEKDPHKRKDTFCEMIRLYDSRGKIIHGGYTEEINIVTTRNYLIRSYLKYFEFLNDDNFSHADFISRLDSEAKNFSMKRKDCQVKHDHNNEYNHSIPDFLFQ